MTHSFPTRRSSALQMYETMREKSMYPAPSRAVSANRRELAPGAAAAVTAVGEQVFADGALPQKTKELIAVAVAHATQCPYCIRGHTERALRQGATQQELMEAIWVAVEMRAGSASAHSNMAPYIMHTAAKPHEP